MIVCQLEGGLGNQLFVQAFGLAYAKKHNLDYCVYTKVNNPHIYDKEPRNLSCYKFPGINYCDTLPDFPIFNEPYFHYAEIPKMDNVIFRGFWQSWRYFDHYRNDILKAFRFDNIKTKKGICSIHVRRDDYLLYPEYHPFIGEMYLTRALIYMTEQGHRKFYIFSDDMQWCKIFFGNDALFGDLSFEFSEGRSAIEDLIEMASCENNITANSSFSLLASYINPNPNKKIIMPAKWFGEKLNHDTSDLYPKNCLVL